MPRGVPVATVSIGGAENAAILAAEILSISDPKIKQNLTNWRNNMTEKIILDHENN